LHEGVQRSARRRNASIVAVGRCSSVHRWHGGHAALPFSIRSRSLACSVALLAALPASGLGATGSVGGAAPGDAGGSRTATAGAQAGGARVETLVPVQPATVLADGTASPPAGAPPQVAAVLAAGNEIAVKPYRWGGGHRRWRDRGYDCSGSVSFALHGGELLELPYDSTGFMRFGDPGPGRWITIYANRGHVFMVVAGLRFDTSGPAPSRWQNAPRTTRGFRVRHPTGF
jgi:hypothetical protein